MILRTRPGVSRALPAWFLALGGLPLVALGGLGWQLLAQDGRDSPRSAGSASRR